MSETEKKNADETLENIKTFLDCNKNAQLASKVDKGKSKSKTEESIAERTILNEMVAEIEKEEKNINNKLFKNYFTKYQSPSDIYKKIRKTKGKKNEDQVYAVKKVLNKIKKLIENVPKDKVSRVEENEKIIDIVDNILEFNRQQEGRGLKILTPNQMLSILPISLAQLKQEITLKNLRMKLDNYCILCRDQRNLQINSIKV